MLKNICAPAPAARGKVRRRKEVPSLEYKLANKEPVRVNIDRGSWAVIGDWVMALPWGRRNIMFREYGNVGVTFLDVEDLVAIKLLFGATITPNE